MRIQQHTSAAPPRATWYTQNGVGTVATTTESIALPTASPALWPDAVAYREAIQNPQAALAPPELRRGAVSQDRRGLPLAYSGRFAVVFRVSGTEGRQWALRCFTSAPQEEVIARTDRYRLIAAHVSQLGDAFVPFRYFAQGIQVSGTWYPIVAMRWASGETLGKFTDRNINNPDALRTLAGTLSALLKRLEDAGIAHGDWQHDNLLVSEDGAHVTLVDYDGMFVPEFEGFVAEEIGHPNYQHPLRTPVLFGAQMDRFACLVMQAALLALAHTPGLWARFSDGESLLFKKADFVDPSLSPVFRALREVAATHQDELLADTIARLEDACRHTPEATMEPVVLPLTSALAPGKATGWDALPTAATFPLRPSEAAGSTAVLEPLPVSLTDNARWWLDGPAITLPDPVKAQQLSTTASGKWFTAASALPTVPGTAMTVSGGAGQAQAYRPVETWAFIERVYRAETLQAERKHFAASRVGVAVLTAFTVLFLLSLFGHGGAFPFYLFFWVFNLGSLGYANWPRKKIHDELEAEIAKMEKLMNERREKIAARRNAWNASGLVTKAASFVNVNDYVNDTLAKTDIQHIMSINGMGVATIRNLRTEGITTALQINGRTSIPSVSTDEIAALHQWCADLKLRAANEYRHNAAIRLPNHSTEIMRLEQEAAEFERERDRLLREKSQFPDVRFWNVYWRKLFGMPEQNYVAPSTP